MRISGWSSDVCSSDLGQSVAASASSNMLLARVVRTLNEQRVKRNADMLGLVFNEANRFSSEEYEHAMSIGNEFEKTTRVFYLFINQSDAGQLRSEEHTSELQSLMRISYAVFCLKKKTKRIIQNN